ncbi:MAG TPA: aminotransferase class I/II-fold pyridoxal phosphate-dependent enzyme, partial [Candidatus Lokiarchaeia archaeon]|nr:aminotransferase class I/II-fold pyridoxal phosphate-dependent enzyme [Candidatus Lokiarchaeia archaeon]
MTELIYLIISQLNVVKFAESGTVEFFNRAKQLEAEGQALIHLEVGELDFPPPDFVIEDAREILATQAPKYTSSRGIIELREQIAIYLERRYHMPRPDPRTDVIVTPGAKFGLFLSTNAILGPGDECILFSPYFPSFKVLVE